MNDSSEKVEILKKEKKKIKKGILAIIILLIVLIAATLYFGRDYIFTNETKVIKKESKKEEKTPPVEEKKLQIIDLESKTRPIGLMIDNVKAAWPQVGLNDAYLIYEIIVEGGQTRLFALFKDKDTSMIGPVRSSRHYYLDYALENDAIYAHFGWSPQAQRDISLLRVNNLNGMTNAGSAYWRASDVVAPHNVFTSMSKLKTSATNSRYNLESDKPNLLNYSIDEINLDKETNTKIANNVKITYSSYYYTSYEYDPLTKLYKRSMIGIPQKDKVTKEQYTAKNIIVINVNNYPDPDNSDKGRQALKNVGNGNGYFITNGYAIPITWEKSSRSNQTIYKKLDGTEITVNDGITYIQIQPLNKELIIE